MLAKRTTHKLLLMLLSVIIAFAMTVSATTLAYAEEGNPDPVIVMKLSPDGRTVSDAKFIYNGQKLGYALNLTWAVGQGPGSSTELMVETYKKQSDGSWKWLHYYGTYEYSGEEWYFLGATDILSIPYDGIGAYRCRPVYYDNNLPYAVYGDYFTFSVIADPNTPSVVTPPVVDQAPIPPVITPTPALSGVSNGKVKATKVPSADFAINQTNGLPTGSVKFTLQKKVKDGKKWKWKSAGTQNVKFNSTGKATAKFANAKNAASYRYKAEYAGDEHYKPVATTWKTFKVVNAKGVAKKAVKVYSKADNKGKKLTTFKKGKSITITGTSGKSYKITFKKRGKAIIGYISKNTVKVK